MGFSSAFKGLNARRSFYCMAICYYCFHLRVFHVDMEDGIHKIMIYDMPHACLLFLRVRHPCAVSLRPSTIRDVLSEKSQFSNKKYRHSQTDAAVTLRKVRRKSNFAPVWTEYTYGQLYMSVQWVQLKSQLQHTGNYSAAAWLPRSPCCRPAVFFCRLTVAALSLPQGKIRRDFQSCHYFYF